MTYLQVDDRFADHPKVAVLSDAAFRAHVSALCYCSAHLTDGVFPKTVGDRLARPKVRTELLAGGLWLEAPGGYGVHDYLDWNPSREQVLAVKAAKREAGAKGGAAASARASASAQALGVEQEQGEEQGAFDRFWAPYPAKVAKKAARKAFIAALKHGANAEEIIAGAQRYRDDPNRRATAHASTWLNAERWNDGPLPSFDRGTPDRAAQLRSAAAQLREGVGHGGARGDRPALEAAGGVSGT